MPIREEWCIDILATATVVVVVVRLDDDDGVVDAHCWYPLSRTLSKRVEVPIVHWTCCEKPTQTWHGIDTTSLLRFHRELLQTARHNHIAVNIAVPMSCRRRQQDWQLPEERLWRHALPLLFLVATEISFFVSSLSRTMCSSCCRCRCLVKRVLCVLFSVYYATIPKWHH